MYLVPQEIPEIPPWPRRAGRRDRGNSFPPSKLLCGEQAPRSFPLLSVASSTTPTRRSEFGSRGIRRLGITGIGADQPIQIRDCARLCVKRNGVAANQEVSNFPAVEDGQEFFEVRRKHFWTTPACGTHQSTARRRRSAVRWAATSATRGIRRSSSRRGCYTYESSCPCGSIVEQTVKTIKGSNLSNLPVARSATDTRSRPDRGRADRVPEGRRPAEAHMHPAPDCLRTRWIV